MLFLKERIQVICDQLKKFSCVEKEAMGNLKIKKGKYFTPIEAENSEIGWSEFDTSTMHWYGSDKYYWFKKEVVIPEKFDGVPLWLIIKTQINEWDDGKNPQFLLFMDGKIVQGMDMNHREVKLFDKAVAGEKITLDFQAYTGTLHEEFKLIVELAHIDPDIEGLYYDLQVPVWAMDRMDNEERNTMQIIEILNDTINLIDLRDVYSEEFYESVKRARGHVADALYSAHAGYDDIIATCIGHTHIDVAWWWTVEETRSKVARSFATVLKLMDEYPEYKFISSQPILYLFLKERYPEIYEKVKEKVEEGRWEAEGGMWVEADCNVTSGESLVRQFLFGKKFFKDEFNVDNRVLWLPDVFGYSGALPQIMKKSGIDYFMTTKLSWNQYNKVPYDTLLWEGIDGSRVLAHFISTLGVGQSSENFFTTYNGMLHPDSIIGGWERYQNKDINNDILIAYGYGDGGGGSTREMVETGRRMAHGVKGIPKVRHLFVREYFEELEKRVVDNKRLPIWTGEFYFEYHRGTFTSMARNKRSNRKGELLLMDVEFLSSLACIKGYNYPKPELDELWKIILINQFHDILPGTSIHEVYEVTKKEYAHVEKKGKSLIKDSLGKIIDEGDDIIVVNTLGFNRDDFVSVPENISALKDRDGNIYPIQNGVAYVGGIPSKGYKSFEVVDVVEDKSPFEINSSGIDTPFYSILFDECGRILSFYDKEQKRNIFKDGELGNLIRVYEDKPIYYDNWDIDMFYTEKSWDVDNLVNKKWTDNGHLFAVLELEWAYCKSVIHQQMIFYSDSKRVDFKTHVDWKESQQLMKVHFPFDIHTNKATFDIQFGNLTRDTHTNTSWDRARFESCGQQWMDVSEGDYGISLLNDCKYGYSVDKSEVALTLIKSGIEPNLLTDQEEHFFTYALLPHDGTWKDANTPKEAAKLNQNLYAVKGAIASEEAYSLFSLDSLSEEHVMLETVKQAEDGSGFIVRMYDYFNKRGTVTLNCAYEIAKAYETDLMENPVEEIEPNGNSVSVNIKPFEIFTLRIII